MDHFKPPRGGLDLVFNMQLTEKMPPSRRLQSLPGKKLLNSFTRERNKGKEESDSQSLNRIAVTCNSFVCVAHEYFLSNLHIPQLKDYLLTFH
jgi:hypothetical protein